MARHNYEISNLAFNDADQKVKYNAVKISSPKRFHIPVNMGAFEIAACGNQFKLSCTSTLDEVANYSYTKKQLDNKLDEFRDDIINHIRNNIDVSDQSSASINDDKLWIKFKSIELV